MQHEKFVFWDVITHFKTLLLDKNEKYYLEDIFERFIEPYFSINNYIIYFGWDQISRAYRYVVAPKGDINKFLSFFLHKYDKIDDFEMIIIYTNVDENNNQNTRKLMFLLPYDDIHRFNSFYMDFVKELDEKSLKEAHIGFIRPIRPSV